MDLRKDSLRFPRLSGAFQQTADETLQEDRWITILNCRVTPWGYLALFSRFEIEMQAVGSQAVASIAQMDRAAVS